MKTDTAKRLFTAYTCTACGYEETFSYLETLPPCPRCSCFAWVEGQDVVDEPHQTEPREIEVV